MLFPMLYQIYFHHFFVGERMTFFYYNTKPDIVISVVFSQNEDLVIAYWNIE